MKVWAIALNTLREAIRNKILYSIVFFAVLMVGIAAVFGSASIGDPMKFVKDFALLSISLFGVVIAVVLGVNLLSMELGKKTIFNILSKPVARWQFVLGKFAGLWITVALTVTLMGAALVAVLAASEGRVDWGIALAITTVLLELFIVTAVAIFFSAAVVTPALAGMFTAAVFIAGRSSHYLTQFYSPSLEPAEAFSPVTQVSAKVLYWLLPHLDRFNIADQVVYGDRIEPAYLVALVVYTAAYTGILLLLGIALFQRREFT